jgi:hypothetical protein
MLFLLEEESTTMEEFFYIILLVVWLVVSIYKRNAKAKGQPGKPKSQPDATTSLPRETDLEEMLEDLFGGGKKKKAGPVADEEVLTEAEVVNDYQEVVSEQGTREETVYHADAEPAYQSWESKAQRAYNAGQDTPKEFALPEPVYESFYKDQSQETESYVAVEKAASVEDLIRSHAAKDAMDQARAEMEYGGGLTGDLPEFDLRTAVIFSEILNRKYT